LLHKAHNFNLIVYQTENVSIDPIMSVVNPTLNPIQGR